MTSASLRRWLASSLRMLFVVVTVFGCLLGWLAYDLNWIRERHALLTRHDAMLDVLKRRLAAAENVQIGDRFSVGHPTSTAPAQLCILGEAAITDIDFAFFAVNGQSVPSELEWCEVELARRLFPDAQIEWRLLTIPPNPMP